MRKNIILIFCAITISFVNSIAQNKPANKEPLLKIGTYVFDTVKKIPMKEILKFEKLEVTNLNYSVVSYEISFISSDSVLYTRIYNNDKISPEIKEKIKKLEPGNRILFDSLKVRDKAGKTKLLRNAIIKLKVEPKSKEPVLKLGKYEIAAGTNIEIPIKDFLTFDGITINSPYTIISFDLTFQINNVVKIMNNESGKFSKQVKESFINLKPGKINIDNIKIKHEDGTKESFPAIDVIVKENPKPKDPILKIGNYVFETSKEVSLKDVVNFEKIEIDAPGYTIVSYDLSVFVDGLTYEVTSNTDKIPETIKQKLPKLKPGGNIVIENIKIKNADEKIINMPSVIIKVKK
ncbi:MAG: GldM family protein [Bacteroidales bacterium]|jgi:hypothetical protein